LGIGNVLDKTFNSRIENVCFFRLLGFSSGPSTYNILINLDNNFLQNMFI